jgi:hypothetical protein
MTSRVYRQASYRKDADRALKIDPGNQLLWRMRSRRLESEVIRDSILATSGKLNRSIGGPSVRLEYQPDGMVVVSKQHLADPADQWRRSLYMFTRRNYNLTMLSAFDQPVMSTNCVRRVSSSVVPQSLTLRYEEKVEMFQPGSEANQLMASPFEPFHRSNRRPHDGQARTCRKRRSVYHPAPVAVRGDRPQSRAAKSATGHPVRNYISLDFLSEKHYGQEQLKKLVAYAKAHMCLGNEKLIRCSRPFGGEPPAAVMAPIYIYHRDFINRPTENSP